MMPAKPDLMETLEREGVTLRKRGRYFWACCPLHEDKTPSFSVDPDRQRYKCFGCGEHGDVIDLIQRLHNLSFKDALKHLGIQPGKPPQVDPRARRKRALLKDFERWRRDRYNDLCDFYNDIWHVLRECKDMEEISQHAPIIHELSQIESEIETLSRGSNAELYELYRTRVRPGRAAFSR